MSQINKFTEQIKKLSLHSILFFLIKWSLIGAVIGFLAGSASAFFLVALNWATDFRDTHLWIIALLPLAGLLIGALYYYLGKGVESGNNVLVETLNNPGETIPFKMAPLVLVGSIITHLFGGSAGREGTAVQMSGAIADQFTSWFKFNSTDRSLLIIAGISAGFASIFGTPLAGTIFALEVFLIGRMRYEALFPALIAAVIADYVTEKFWLVGHTPYSISLVPELSPLTILYALLTGICFGLTALLFTKVLKWVSEEFKVRISYPPLRPFIGGMLLVVLFFGTYYFLHTTKYFGLGIPTIVEAFEHPLPSYDFMLKLLLTALTLGCGFKGGEVTPLFFIGAALGSALSAIVPLPTALLAGMGFVAVFAGAANTPIACIFLAIELFGASCGIYAGIACIVAYLCSGHTGIYSAQRIGSAKNEQLTKEEGKRISDLENK